MDLTKLRKEIDHLDHKLINLLHRRKTLVEKVGLFKKKRGLPVFNKAREKEIYKKLDKWAIKHGFRKTFLQKIWKTMMDEAKVIQKKVKR
jgi:chorismate mutase